MMYIVFDRLINQEKREESAADRVQVRSEVIATRRGIKRSKSTNLGWIRTKVRARTKNHTTIDRNDDVTRADDQRRAIVAVRHRNVAKNRSRNEKERKSVDCEHQKNHSQAQY